MLSSQPEKDSPYLKSLPPWEELDYHQRPRRLRTRRWWFTLAGCLMAVGYGAWSIQGDSHRVHQAGPVATAHAWINDDCTRCHTETLKPLGRLFHGDTVRSVPDAACNTCHHGPMHNPHQTSVPECATCHREHRGKPTLADVADKHCTSCHHRLERSDGKSATFANVSSFEKDHPEFRAVRPSDQAKLKFNHQHHLTLDLKALRDQGRAGLGQYGDKLDCTSCHQPDAQRRYMQPIRYEQHCASCHRLDVQLAGEFQDGKARKAAEAFRKTPAPHREPQVVRGVLRERLVEFVRQNPVVPGGDVTPESARPIPGSRSLNEGEWRWVKKQLNEAEELLFLEKQRVRLERPLFPAGGQCAHCHEPMHGRPDPEGLPRYEPTNVPARWFAHSVFRHDSHRMLQCVQCHAQALTSKATSDVLLPKKESCVQCHSARGGARTGCVECHTYHDRTLERGFDGPHRIHDFSRKN